MSFRSSKAAEQLFAGAEKSVSKEGKISAGRSDGRNEILEFNFDENEEISKSILMP